MPREQNAQIPMAVVGIVMKFFQIVISIVVGMAAGCIPVVGYNVELFPGALIGIFGAANESAYYTAFAIKAFRVYLCMMSFACVNKACFIFMQAMGKALEPTILSMVREIVLGVGFATVAFSYFFHNLIVFRSFSFSSLLSFFISANRALSMDDAM
ncbi:hypothetical protein SAMN05216391_1075 [Lachnospiraceae bacterium KHCPX20]|nr:hypothetical protein SAMN05216391_1075 [Lachnospiraceae bacterium KHCPX20]